MRSPAAEIGIANPSPSALVATAVSMPKCTTSARGGRAGSGGGDAVTGPDRTGPLLHPKTTRRVSVISWTASRGPSRVLPLLRTPPYGIWSARQVGTSFTRTPRDVGRVQRYDLAGETPRLGGGEREGGDGAPLRRAPS